MVKQCPRCWAKVDPEDKVCPNCGFDLVNRTMPGKTSRAPKAEQEKKERVVFPKARQDKPASSFPLKLVSVLTVLWGIIAVLGGIANFANDELLQGAGFLASGVIALIVYYMFISCRRYNTLACILLLISGAATLQIPLLIVAFVLSFILYGCRKFFDKAI